MKTAMDAPAGPLIRAGHDLSRGRPDRALAALESVTGSELETHEFWSVRAAALYEVRRWSEAIEAARQGLERWPDDFELLGVLALAQLERGKRKDARATIDAALELYPDAAVLHAHRGLILMRSAQKSFRLASYKRARAAADEALRLDPECETALRVRAQIAAVSGDRRAVDYGTELLSRAPEDELAHVVAGATLARRGDVKGGLRHYEEAARLDPADPQMAWIGRNSRALQSKFAAPLLHAERLTRGNLRFAWVFVMIAIAQAHQPLLTAAAGCFWVYMWAVHIYVRVRAGKAPK
jgi:tetratricopeptide (TPR) repeat protein